MITTIKINASGERYIELSDELLKQLSWKTNDVLSIETALYWNEQILGYETRIELRKV